ncbi:uncharacterized protein PG986_011176 [Apiospora aurea]|uniref:Uncharacterized protein n=1 Tax=Apiospora aurea TaxID=335848 RepID=A0ABR1Q4I3_9PEZI
MADKSVNVTRTSVLEDGTLPFPIRGPKTLRIPVERDVAYAKNALRGLNLLQTRYDAAIASQSLSSALEYLYEHLPTKVSDLVTWHSPDDFDIFPADIGPDDNAAYRRFLEQHPKHCVTSYKAIRQHEYFIQQVNTHDDHYVTVLLHLRKDDHPRTRWQKRVPFTTVDFSAFVDPSVSTTDPASEARVARVRARMAEFLRPVLSNIDDRAAHEGELWVPRQFTRRLVELWCEGKSYDAETLWRPTCAYMNLEKARDDMIGAASRQVRRYMGFTPRVSLSLLKGPKNGKEDPQAFVLHRLATPRDVGQIGDFRFGGDDEDDSEANQSDSDDDTASEASDDSSPSAQKGKPIMGLPCVDLDDSEDEEDLQQNVDDAFMRLAGADDADDEEEEEKQDPKPASSKVSSPTMDVEMAEGPEVIAIEDDDDDAPIFSGPQWPNEIPRPASSAARYLANRLDPQAPGKSFVVDSIVDDNLSVEGNTFSNDQFEIEVETPPS